MDEEKRGQVQTVKEMFAQYPDEWIFFEVQHSATFYSGPIVPKGSEVLPWLIATPSSA